MSAIEFTVYDNQEHPVDLSGLEALAGQVWRGESGPDGTVNIILVNNDYIVALNTKYLSKATTTDVIAFPIDSAEGVFEGEVYISIDQVAANATVYGCGTDRELRRVLIHGLLHFLGYDDHTVEGKREMSEREDYYLSGQSDGAS